MIPLLFLVFGLDFLLMKFHYSKENCDFKAILITRNKTIWITYL